MRSLICFVVLAGLAAAAATAATTAKKVPWNNLSATWSFGGVASRLLNTAFFELPTTQADAVKQGWVQARAENTTTLWCLPDDPRVCLLYDLKGSIAAIQIAFPTEDLKTAPYDWSKHSLFSADNVLGYDVARGRYYLVDQEVLASGGRASFDEVGTGLWLQDGDHLINVPLDATQLEAQGWTKESCIPTMGRHFYMNVTPTMDCQNMEPYFLIADNSKNWVHGVGFQSFGEKSHKDRQWLEDVPALAVKPTLPNAPQCLVDWADEYGVLSIHVYFRKTPYFILC